MKVEVSDTGKGCAYLNGIARGPRLTSALQIYYLTMDIRAHWPRYWGELGDVYKLSMINTQAFDLGRCPHRELWSMSQ